ncbi:MAG: phytanoyl-CoA dioxygenase family protein [Actinobacteria bacterium]|nr:phytanoyl-CoA dioxygenase family protein [Actinomycetota bacterium]
MAIATPTGLNDMQRATFEREGYLLLPGALSRDEVGRLDQAVDRVWWAHRDAPPVRGAEALHLLAFLGSDEAFLELLDHPATLPIVAGLLGWNIFMYHCHLDVHPPEPADSTPRWRWHQDGGRQNVELETEPRPRMSVKVAYFLSDCGEPGRGNFRVVPGSHRRNTLPRPVDGALADPGGAVPVLAGAGDAVIFDRRLWHMRSPNQSELTRRALFIAYTYRWVRPRDELQVRPELLAHITPVRAQLLGAGGGGAIGYWMPPAEAVPLRAHIPGD